MNKIFLKLKIKIKKNHKKGFTLLESVLSLAIFAIVATLFTAFALTSNKMISDSIKISKEKNNLTSAINEMKDNEKEKITVEKNTEGKVIIDSDNAMIFGPSGDKKILGKKVKKIIESSSDIEKVDNIDTEIDVVVATQHDEKNKPIRKAYQGTLK